MADKPECKYGNKCYRKNAGHRQKFVHKSKSPSPPSTTTPKANVVKKRTSTVDIDAKSKCSKVDIGEGWANLHRKYHQLIEEKFLQKMPDDFYSLWQFAVSIDSDHPIDAFKRAKDAKLVGAFDMLADRIDSSASIEDCINRNRFAFDPPELQTVVTFDGGHYGYWRDGDDIDEPIVVRVDNGDGHFAKYSIVGDNLFAALHDLMHADKQCKELLASIDQQPFDIGKLTDRIRRRKKRIVAPCLHSIGIVVKVVNDIGYRSLGDSNDVIKRMLQLIGADDDDHLRTKKMDSLHQLVSYVQFANDEMDFGMGLELGHDLFIANYPSLDSLAKQILSTAYTLLDRPIHLRILNEHMKQRRLLLNDVINNSI